MTSTFRPDLRSANTLPIRVAGIVFWGLVVIGVLVVITMLSGREQEIVGQQQATVNEFVSRLYREAVRHPVAGVDEAATLAHRLSSSVESIQALFFRTGEREFYFGHVDSDSVSYMQTVELPRTNSGYQTLAAQITLYLPSVQQQVATSRKQMLLGMGGLFLLFGLILQRVLEYVLTRPFENMINAAQSFSAGNEAVRFDDQRSDEFGYLGRFINQALDYSIERKDALHAALERARDSEQELYREKEKAMVTLHSIGDAVITTDQQGRVCYMNPVAEELLGWSFSEIQDAPLGKVMRLVDEDTGKSVESPVDQCLALADTVVGEGQRLLVRHDGGEIAITDTAAPIVDQQGELVGAVLVFHDVGQARKLARQLSFQARHDPLTGLSNRREFEVRLHELLESARGRGLQHAVCYIDLDQFKVVNDVCGHSAGDELLRQLAVLLQSQVREADVISRLGGDEFGLLLTHCSAEQAIRIAENIRSSVREFRFLYNNRSFEVGASIGIVSVSENTRSVADILSAADIACYAAKDNGRNCVYLYEPTDGELDQRRGEMNWVAGIRSALDDERFYLLYQPVVSLDAPNRGCTSHYEFLLRMRDDMGNEVLPMAFLPAAQRYGMMQEIDTLVVNSVVRLLTGAEPVPDKGVFILNLCGESLSIPTFIDFVCEQVMSGNLPKDRICFEITESSAITNLRSIRDAIQRLRNLGCQFALDDFGSGLSAFGYLKGMQVDYIKIDGGLVRDMVQDEMNAAMVRAINEIGHIQGVKTIAEFVETDEILERLIELGVDYAQGHSIAAPRPVEELFRVVPQQKPCLSLIRSR